jgi:hypothetical protein
MLYLKTQSVPRCKHFYLGYKNQSIYAVSGASRSLFSDKYKTHKYSVGRTYSCWKLMSYKINKLFIATVKHKIMFNFFILIAIS